VYLETNTLMEKVHHHLVFASRLPLLPYQGVWTGFLRNSRFKSRARSLVFKPWTQELTNSVGVWIFCQDLVWLRKTAAGRFYGFGFFSFHIANQFKIYPKTILVSKLLIHSKLDLKPNMVVRKWLDWI